MPRDAEDYMGTQRAATLDRMGQEKPQPSVYVDLEEAAAILLTSTRTLRRWTAEGRVTAVSDFPDRKLRYRRDVIEAFGKPQPDRPAE